MNDFYFDYVLESITDDYVTYKNKVNNHLIFKKFYNHIKFYIDSIHRNKKFQTKFIEDCKEYCYDNFKDSQYVNLIDEITPDMFICKLNNKLDITTDTYSISIIKNNVHNVLAIACGGYLKIMLTIYLSSVSQEFNKLVINNRNVGFEYSDKNLIISF